MTIREAQDAIINEFALLEGDQEMTLVYLIEIGQKMPQLPESAHTEENIVKGCQSRVWLTARLENGRVWFEADSNTAITKGLVALLVRTLSGQRPESILQTELDFMQAIKMDRFIGTQRSNGFASMVKQMKLYALAYKAKMETTES